MTRLPRPHSAWLLSDYDLVGSGRFGRDASVLHHLNELARAVKFDFRLVTGSGNAGSG